MGRGGGEGRRGISDLDEYCGEYVHSNIYSLCIISPMICTFSFMYVLYNTIQYITYMGWCIGIGLQFWNMY